MPTFSHLTPRLPVRSLARTLAFYREHLGFDLDIAWPESEPTFAILRREFATVGFFERTEHQPGPIGYAELYIEVVDARVLHAAISPAISIEWGPEVYSYGRLEFAIRDPDEYLVIFTEPTDQTPTTHEPD